MAFARHETFYFRDGWLRKGIRMVQREGFQFFRRAEAPDELGIGKNMVRALKFWLQACRLVEPDYNDPKKEYKISTFGQSILEYDKYFEDIGTLLLIHYQLVTNAEDSTTWNWFFNKFRYKEFDDQTFLYELKKYTLINGMDVAENSLKKDFQCLMNTYLFERYENSSHTPEDNLSCPLRELRLLTRVGAKAYRLCSINKRLLDPLIVLYVLKDQFNKSDLPGLSISDLLEAENQVGRVFNFSYEDLIFYLDRLQEMGFISIKRGPGLDRVVLKDISTGDILQKYYLKSGDLM